MKKFSGTASFKLLPAPMEVPSFTNSEYMIRGKILKTGHVTMTTPIRG